MLSRRPPLLEQYVTKPNFIQNKYRLASIADLLTSNEKHKFSLYSHKLQVISLFFLFTLLEIKRLYHLLMIFNTSHFKTHLAFISSCNTLESEIFITDSITNWNLLERKQCPAGGPIRIMIFQVLQIVTWLHVNQVHTTDDIQSFNVHHSPSFPISLHTCKHLHANPFSNQQTFPFLTKFCMFHRVVHLSVRTSS